MEKNFLALSAAIVIAAAILSAGVIYGQPEPETKYYALVPSGNGLEAGASGNQALAIPLQITENVKTISVSGVSEKAMEPEKVDIYFGVETTAMNAADAAQENADKASAIRDALSAIGVPRDSIETTSYSIQDIREYNSSTRKYEFKGYRVAHSLKVSLEDNLDRAGPVIDAAVGAGANDVSSIVFGLKNSTVEQLKKQLLQEAAQNARAKADSIASGLNVSVTGIQSASESTYYSPLYSRTYDMAEGAVSGAPTEFVAGDVKVSASVSVSFTIE